MQVVEAAFTAESRDRTRKIAQSTQVSWKRDFSSTFQIFTIGVSTIGGSHYIGGPAGVQSAWNRYRYFNESAYVTQLDYERTLDMPLGGAAKAQADIMLDNTSGRFTPRPMGGRSELFTAVLPARPLIVNTGFNYGGIDKVIPSFVGTIDRQPQIDLRRGRVELHASDFLNIVGNKQVDTSVMYTGIFADDAIANILTSLGFSTAQYELDQGINRIPFMYFKSGDNLLGVIDQIVQAENGHFYQSEEGVLKFENRQHWDSAPYTQVQQVIYTADVLEAGTDDSDHIINVVEVTGTPREVQTNQLIWQLSGYAGGGTVTLGAGADIEIWASFDDPIFTIDTPVRNGTANQTSYFVANTKADASGTDSTSSVYLKASDKFAQSMRMVFHNNSSLVLYLTTLDLWGRPARKTGDVYYRETYGASVTAYDEHKLSIDSEYIQSSSWAQSFARVLLEQYSRPENLQQIVIRAKPQLQLGDLVSWQGRYWTIYGIRAKMNPSEGYVQELSLLQRTIKQYFRIGISTIGGSHMIAP